MDYVNDYFNKHDTFHEEDRIWKIEIFKSFLLEFINNIDKKTKTIKILEVGGNGLFLRSISESIKDDYNINVKKHFIDISKDAVRISRENNPDIISALVSDIKKTSFKDKEFDLVIMNDIIEHIDGDYLAMEEINRISRYAYFKVPTEDSLLYNILNFISIGAWFKKLEMNLGHINRYSYKSFTNLLIHNFHSILKLKFSNSFEYFLRKNCPAFQNKPLLLKLIYKIYSIFGYIVYKFNPTIASNLFSDFILVLVKSK